MNEYRFAEGITRKQLEYAYANDVKEITKEIENLENIINSMGVMGIDDDKYINDLKQKIKDYKIQLNNMKVEKDLMDLTIED